MMTQENKQVLLHDIYGTSGGKQNYCDFMERILNNAIEYANCDAGTVYIVEDGYLHFKILKNKSRKMSRNLIIENKVDEIFTPIAISDVDKYTVARCAQSGELANIKDLYDEDKEVVGSHKFDENSQYKTRSVLNFPMKNEKGDVIGVIQLINAMKDGKIANFDPSMEESIKHFGTQAGLCLQNMILTRENGELLDSMVDVLTSSLDENQILNTAKKEQVMVMMNAFVQWLRQEKRELQFSDSELNEMMLAVRLHDIGKLNMPEQIMDKSSRLGNKLEMVFNRFERLMLYTEVANAKDKITFKQYTDNMKILEEGKALVYEMNTVEEIPLEKLEQLRVLGTQTFISINDSIESVLKPDELTAIMVPKGFRTSEEKEALKKHSLVTEKMLSGIKFTKDYSNVKEWASKYYELLNGTGYPHRLQGKDIPIPTRLMTILDHFVVLLEQYKSSPSPSQEAIQVLRIRAKAGELDDALVLLLGESGVWNALEH